MEICQELRLILEVDKESTFRRFISWDEGLFSLEFHPLAKWNVSRVNVHQKVEQPITAQKFVSIGI
jgi:hypothetical protein